MADNTTSQPPLNYNEYVIYKLGQIESKLDEVKAGQASGIVRADGIDSRLTKLENNKYWITGAAAGISSVVGLFVKYVAPGHL